MSFRSRLRVFFTIIVIVPMIAVALVLFSITSDSELGKSDARLAAGLQAAFGLYERAAEDARGALRVLARDPDLQGALSSGRPARIAPVLRTLVRRDPEVRSAQVVTRAGRVVSAGSTQAIAPASAAPTTTDGERLGTLVVSTTTPRQLLRDIQRVTGLEVRLAQGGTLVASTFAEQPGRGLEPRSGDVDIAGSGYRGRVQQVTAPEGLDPISIGLFQDADALSSSIDESRLLIGGILLAFLLLALASSVFVVRALQGQVEQFLQAARRLGHGEFDVPVPTQGSDEFAALGMEFNAMARALEGQIAEVEDKRLQLEGALRSVGDAFAAGLDRQGVVDLVVHTSMQACSARAGRALPLDAGLMSPASVDVDEPRLERALRAVERAAFAPDGAVAAEIASDVRGEAGDGNSLRPLVGQTDGVQSLALPLRARLGSGSVEYVGIISICREARPFSEAEKDLFAYLAGQATVSIENAELHETVQMQALTDELTGLFNIRHFHIWLDDELERTKRFGRDIGLVMFDLDNFKQLNDTYGHQQGDETLVQVARAIRGLLRAVDEPVRYGGEEFAVVLPETDGAQAEQAAERMRAAVESVRIPRVDGDGVLQITASFGVAALPEAASDKEGLIAAADAALYRAKRGGKNRVECAEQVPAPH